MEITYQLVAVAFVRNVGGRVQVLLAIDHDGTQLLDGDPVLLAVHRPGDSPRAIVVEGPDGLDEATCASVVERSGEALAQLVESAFDDAGTFDGARMLGSSIAYRGASGCFEM